MKRNVLINRPVFTQRDFQSGALTVLTSLFHRFTEPGTYDLFVRREGQVIHRTQLRVIPEGGPSQINLDLAKLGDTAEAQYTLPVDGVLGFFVSQGTASYTVSIDRLGKREKATVLDSSKLVAEGDVFALTLVRPGTYQVLSQSARGRGKGEIHVNLKRGEGHRTDQATLVSVAQQGLLRPGTVRIMAGQTVAFRCAAPTRISVELVKPAVIDRPTDRRRRRTTKAPGLGVKP